MPVHLTWYGHATWLLETANHRILIDPFFDENPSSPTKSKVVDADYILVSHGHFDHVGEAAEIANRCDATIVSNFEIATWFAKTHGVKKTIGMNLGGCVDLPFGRVQSTLAFHSSTMADGTPGGSAGGFLLEIEQLRLYFACDTALFSDMKLIASKEIDWAMLPIGDLYTMGPGDALAAVKLLQPNKVIPAHYNTWPPIEQDAAAWAEAVRKNTTAQPTVMEPGDTILL